ncbi:MAG: hypothetical protein IPL20_06570 [Saprospiraceae bacterium]|nr:hypothetical protein [Saprospiraceae bacterium]
MTIIGCDLASLHFHPDLSLDMNILICANGHQCGCRFCKENFFLPAVFEDQVGNLTKVLYDTHKMYMTKMVDALDNEVNVQKFSYRNLLPWLVVDPNGNRKG